MRQFRGLSEVASSSTLVSPLRWEETDAEAWDSFQVAVESCRETKVHPMLPEGVDESPDWLKAVENAAAAKSIFRQGSVKAISARQGVSFARGRAPEPKPRLYLSYF